MKVFISEEYGWKSWVWDFPGSTEELIRDFRAGRTPSRVGYFETRGRGTIAPAEMPHVDLVAEGLTEERELQLEGELQGMWEVYMRQFEAQCMLHEEDDSYLQVDGKSYRWGDQRKELQNGH